MNLQQDPKKIDNLERKSLKFAGGWKKKMSINRPQESERYKHLDFLMTSLSVTKNRLSWLNMRHWKTNTAFILQLLTINILISV